MSGLYFYSVGAVRKVGTLQKWQAGVGVESLYLHSVSIVRKVGALQNE